MTVQLHGREVPDLYAAAVGETERCTHIVVVVHVASKAVDYAGHAVPHRDALVAAAVERNRRGEAYRIEVRPVKNTHWWWNR